MVLLKCNVAHANAITNPYMVFVQLLKCKLNAHFIVELQYSACFYGFTVNHILRKSCVQPNVKYINWPKCALELKLLNLKISLTARLSFLLPV